MFSVFKIIAFEPVAVICPIYDKNAFDLQSTCYQTVLSLQMLLMERFSH